MCVPQDTVTTLEGPSPAPHLPALLTLPGPILPGAEAWGRPAPNQPSLPLAADDTGRDQSRVEGDPDLSQGWPVLYSSLCITSCGLEQIICLSLLVLYRHEHGSGSFFTGFW